MSNRMKQKVGKIIVDLVAGLIVALGAIALAVLLGAVWAWLVDG